MTSTIRLTRRGRYVVAIFAFIAFIVMAYVMGEVATFLGADMLSTDGA